MKKILAIVLALILSVMVFTACASDTASINTVEADKNKETENSNLNEDIDKKNIYVFVKNRGDLSYWDGIAGGGRSCCCRVCRQSKYSSNRNNR